MQVQCFNLRIPCLNLFMPHETGERLSHNTSIHISMLSIFCLLVHLVEQIKLFLLFVQT